MDLFDPKYLSLPAQVQKNKNDIETLKQTTINAENAKGYWSNTVQYNPGDIVSYRGGSFLARQQSTGQEPPYNDPTVSNDYWQIISLQGQPGETGDTGKTGPQGEPGVGFDDATSCQFSLQDVVYQNGVATFTGNMTIAGDGESFQIPLSFPLPISAGEGVTVDANEEGNGIEISAEGGGATNPYPVGAIYMSVESTNPSTLFGGTWQQIQDTFLLAAGPNHAAGSTGGAETVKLSSSQIPDHTHKIYGNPGSSGGTPAQGIMVTPESGDLFAWSNYQQETYETSHVGASAAHNNMPPFLTVYMWKRVS